MKHALYEILTFLTASLVGVVIACIIWIGLELDDAQLKAGKSPCSGATPADPDETSNK